MSIDNIAIVRAMDAELIPFDGIVKSISESSSLKKDPSSLLAAEWKQVIEKSGQVPPIDWSRFGDDDYMSQRVKMVNEITSAYIPYTSDYNSMVLFSLNGLVPDDSEKGFANNTFSTKPCAVIAPLSDHIEQVVSLVPTDTALKGDVNLSNNAVILIREDIYNSLTDNQKEELQQLDCQCIVFAGNLKEAVNTYLKNSNKYTAESLTLSKEHGWILPSETSEMTKDAINNIAQKNNIAQALHMDILLHQTDDMDKLQSVKDEYENYITIKEYYLKEFYMYLFARIQIEPDIYVMLLNNPLNDYYTKELVSKIEELGIDEYKKIVDSYNKGLEQLKKEGKLPSPTQIINSIKENNIISVSNLVNNINTEEFKDERELYSKKEQISIQQNIMFQENNSLESNKIR